MLKSLTASKYLLLWFVIAAKFYPNSSYAIEDFFISETLSELKKVKSKYGGLPNDGDLQGAAKALNRLQEMYKFNVSQFSRGNILGVQTGAELEAKDTFYLGRSIFNCKCFLNLATPRIFFFIFVFSLQLTTGK